MVWVLNGIWNPKAQPFEIPTKMSTFWMVGTRPVTEGIAWPFENRTIWNQVFKIQDFKYSQIWNGRISDPHWIFICHYNSPKLCNPWSDLEVFVHFKNSLASSTRPKGCCVFRPAFGCWAHPKADWNTFFQPFSTFFVHFKPFSVILRLKSTKNIWKWTKKHVFFKFCLLLKACRQSKAGRLLEGVPRNCLFSEQKRLKMAEKSSSTIFWVHAAPKSWSKYTTKGVCWSCWQP